MADRDANRNAVPLRAQHAARRGAVPVEPLALAPEQGRGNIGSAVDDVADMAHQCRIQDREYGFAVVMSALGMAAHAAARGWCKAGRAGAVGHRLGTSRRNAREVSQRAGLIKAPLLPNWPDQLSR